MSEDHTGGCLCKAVRYRITGDPNLTVACYCKQCQRASGTAFSTSAWFSEAQVEITRGGLKPYRYASDESGRWIEIKFCEICGTTILATIETAPGEVGISVGTLDHPNWLEIKEHIWTTSAHRSIAIPPDAVAFDRGPS